MNQARRIGNLPKWPISAYNASTPVIDSTTAPSAKNETFLYSIKKFSAHFGFNACNTSGLAIMLRAPSTARTINHSSITGAKSLPTLPVPCFWMANSSVSTRIDRGTI
ncbi:hypothetical protein D3C72_1790330 [compost metagenome]